MYTGYFALSCSHTIIKTIYELGFYVAFFKITGYKALTENLES